jgi:hypothetical protein
MFTAQQYHAKAAQYDGLLAVAQSPAEVAEYRDLKRSYASHAENLDWLAANIGKTLSTFVPEPLRRRRRNRDVVEEANILQCLGTAVVLNWNRIPTKLQRALFDAASSVEDSERRAPLREALAQFLHDHKDDAQEQQNGA